jgi:hypothetical protein
VIKEKSDSDEEGDEPENEFKIKFGALYEDVKTDTTMQRLYLVLFLFVRSVIVIIILFLQNYPMC